ncbi:hypothetical protein ABVT39_013464 [Epinephelus coioides]
MAKTENLTVSDTSARELTELLPVILSTHPSNMRIIIHAGSFDILRGKTGSEILKKDFSLLLEKLSDCQSQNVFISGPIPTLGKGIKSFTRLLALNTWLTSACFTHGIKFIDNFNIFWNCKDRFQSDSSEHHWMQTTRGQPTSCSWKAIPKQEWTDKSQGQVRGTETDSLHLSPFT